MHVEVERVMAKNEPPHKRCQRMRFRRGIVHCIFTHFIVKLTLLSECFFLYCLLMI